MEKIKVQKEENVGEVIIVIFYNLVTQRIVGGGNGSILS